MCKLSQTPFFLREQKLRTKIHKARKRKCDWTTQLPSAGGYREPVQDWWLVCRGPVRCKSLACWLHDTHWVCFFFKNSYQTEGWKVASSFFENLIHHFLFVTATFKYLGWTGFKILQCCSVSPTRPFYRWGTSKSGSKDSLVDGWVVAASLACYGCSLLSSRTEEWIRLIQAWGILSTGLTFLHFSPLDSSSSSEYTSFSYGIGCHASWRFWLVQSAMLWVHTYNNNGIFLCSPWLLHPLKQIVHESSHHTPNDVPAFCSSDWHVL